MLLKYFVLHLVLANVACYYLLPERSENVYVNNKYMVSAAITVEKFSRNSPRYIKLVAETLHQWNNNVTANFLLHEKLSNMYKPTFIELHYPICDLVNKEHIIGSMLRKAGLACPFPKGKYSLENMTVTMDDFPNVFLFTHGRAEVLLWITATKEVIYRAYLYWSMLKDNPNRASQAKKPTNANKKSALV